jgi:hypothetical protein
MLISPFVSFEVNVCLIKVLVAYRAGSLSAEGPLWRWKIRLGLYFIFLKMALVAVFECWIQTDKTTMRTRLFLLYRVSLLFDPFVLLIQDGARQGRVAFRRRYGLQFLLVHLIVVLMLIGHNASNISFQSVLNMDAARRGTLSRSSRQIRFMNCLQLSLIRLRLLAWRLLLSIVRQSLLVGVFSKSCCTTILFKFYFPKLQL